MEEINKMGIGVIIYTIILVVFILANMFLIK